jgi:hypothetical protein
MNTSEKDDIFARQAREVFLASAGHLDPEVLARLRAARARAVEAVGQPRARWQSYGWRMPIGAVALLFVAVVGGALLWNGGAPSTLPAPFTVGGNDDDPVVFTSDNLDLYADLDFYQWMETEDQPAAAPDEPEDDEDDGDDDDTGVGG